MSKDEKSLEKDFYREDIQNNKNLLDKSENLNKNGIPVEKRAEDISLRSTSNRVQWLLMELGSLADTLQSLARELFRPVMMHSEDTSQIEVGLKITFKLMFM